MIAGCSIGQVHVLNEQENFKDLISKIYSLKMDCFILKQKASDVAQIMPPDKLVFAFEVDRKYIGKEIDNKRIIGVIPKGTRFQIKEIRSITGFEDNRLEFIITTNYNTLYEGKYLFNRFSKKVTTKEEFVSLVEKEDQTSAIDKE
jgi:hypothetical protein